MIVTELFNTTKLDQTEATKVLNALVKKELIAHSDTFIVTKG
jgi:DNA-binding MarR family transcriptional regulator